MAARRAPNAERLTARCHGRTGTLAGEAAEEALDLAGLPGHQDLAGVEDRRVGAADDADEEGKDEVLRRLSPEEVERQEREDHGHRRVERTNDGLRQTVIDDPF